MPAESWASRRLTALGDYAFAEVDRKVAELRAQGITPIDFGVGDPTVPTPELIRRAAQQGIDQHRSSGYPSYIGDAEFRRAVADCVARRFGVQLDADSEISSSIGSKEAVFNFHEAVVDAGDVVLCPTPGYPPYSRGALFAEGEAVHIPLLAANDFLVDFAAIPSDVARKAKVLWLNYPNSPSGAVATRSFYQDAVRFATDHDLIIASDEAYSEIYFTAEPPLSILEVARERVLVFNSLSKRSAMTGYRVGWVGGDADLVALYRKVKTNLDSGTPAFIQAAAVAALGDEQHVTEFRDQYRRKRDALCAALAAAGLPDCTPAATLYIWQQAPAGMSALDLATALLAPEVGIVTTPGPWIADAAFDGSNPGEGYVRFALVPSEQDTATAADRLRRLRL